MKVKLNYEFNHLTGKEEHYSYEIELRDVDFIMYCIARYGAHSTELLRDLYEDNPDYITDFFMKDKGFLEYLGRYYAFTAWKHTHDVFNNKIGDERWANQQEKNY